MDKTEKILRIVLADVILIVAAVSVYRTRDKKIEKDKKEGYTVTGNYNVDLIKKFHEVDGNSNYLISPYNIEIGLSMLRDGADGKTKEELDTLLGKRNISNVSVKDRVGVANSIFVKDTYKDNVKKDYYSILNTKYNSDVIYDSFKTPEKINKWVQEKTYNMIDKILNNVNKDYVMGLASALAIDVKWLDEFECDNTRSEEFTKVNDEKINVEMMHKTYTSSEYKYFKNDDSEGIVIPYKKEEKSNVQLEFIGILPSGSVDDYIKGLTKEKLDNIDKPQKTAGEKLHINLSLPRFKYDYSASNFIEILKGLGINEAFNPVNANFKNMIEIEDYNVYVGEAIHKTHIELSETGTKAAAVTFFGMYKSSAMLPTEVEEVNIKFDKPFAYMIREANTNEILFFGVVYEPNTWSGSTCEVPKTK